MTVKQIIREIFERVHEREKHTKLILIIAIMPTIPFSSYVVFSVNHWDLPHFILLPFAIVGFYLVMVAAILNIIFGYSTHEVLTPRVSKKVNLLNSKIQRFFSTPNRIDQLEQKIESKNQLIDPELESVLNQIAEDYKTLDNKKMPEVITEIFQRLTALENNTKLNIENKYPCTKCHKLFEAIRPDPTYSNPMRDRCSVCDILSMTIFERWGYPCEYCEQVNYIYWHHKDGHTKDEVRMAEKMFFQKDESD